MGYKGIRVSNYCKCDGSWSSGKVATSQPMQSLPRNKNQRTFFGDARKRRSIHITPCFVCGGTHAIWRCQQFAIKNQNERWRTAEREQLCYRCLGEGHNGKLGLSTRPCGENGCQKLHHWLLHYIRTKPAMAVASD